MRALARLAERLRSRPFKGVGRDAEGRRKRVRLDEVTLARIAVQGDFAYTGQSELSAAFRALRHGDRRPLLRLAAFLGPDYNFDDDYKVESAGLQRRRGLRRLPDAVGRKSAARCTPSSERRGPVRPARLDVRPVLSARVAQVLGPGVLHWPAPADLEPVFVPGVGFPDIPTLVVAAELDLTTTVADGRFVADLFPRSRFVLLRNGGHTPGFYSQCSPPLYIRFINRLKRATRAASSAVTRTARDRALSATGAGGSAGQATAVRR